MYLHITVHMYFLWGELMATNPNSPWYMPPEEKDWVEFRAEPAKPVPDIPEKRKMTQAEREASPWYRAPELPQKWSESKKLKQRLLRRAFEENRGGEVILLIQWRLAQESYLNRGFAAAFREFEKKNRDEPQAIRALNLLEQMEGKAGTHHYDSTSMVVPVPRPSAPAPAGN